MSKIFLKILHKKNSFV